MIPSDTPYKVIKYLVKLLNDKVLQRNYENDKFIIHLVDREFLIEANGNKNKFTTTEKFMELYSKEIFPAFQKYDSFIKHHQIENIESYYSIGDLENLILIDNEKPTELTLQEILSKYYKSSKHTQTNSNLANAIKTILQLDEFAENSKDQQYISILYPIGETRFVFLCENKNKLRGSRHPFIEFWYAGGHNTHQLQFIRKLSTPIFYLFDWDFEGVNIYSHIKKNYFSALTAFIPTKYESLMIKRDEVKHHRSKWNNNICLQYLNDRERSIVKVLIQKDSIIEEQKILLTKENLLNNAIN